MTNNIKELLNENHIKVSEVIEKTGLSRSHFYDVMKGNSIPSLLVARKIADAIGVRLEELFPKEEGE
ncbi:helix-turn-helix transcriptional regulator [Hathewaya massiliensis]|uniref:helix-turn-helix transcriptional regulator n=1 Tax=Hathewaya massiliensis TaxID=1964382 RepID=UPI001156E7A4|nr:helix-turn-helix transcriptional regulator [Hathewaya massiliensis]